MKLRVSIRWTETAKAGLSRLPKKVRKGLLEKADELLGCDPRKVNKPLMGPLSGYYRIVDSRYRAIYTVEEEVIARGKKVLHLTVHFIAAGIRKEHDKKDVYRVAEKLVRLVLDKDDPLEDLPESEND